MSVGGDANNLTSHVSAIVCLPFDEFWAEMSINWTNAHSRDVKSAITPADYRLSRTPFKAIRTAPFLVQSRNAPAKALALF
jgi:hypothetical protein